MGTIRLGIRLDPRVELVSERSVELTAKISFELLVVPFGPICKRGNVREDNAVRKIGLVVRKYDHYDDETDKVGVGWRASG